MNFHGIFISQIHTKLYMQNKQSRFSFTYFPLAKEHPVSQHLGTVIFKEEKTSKNKQDISII